MFEVVANIELNDRLVIDSTVMQTVILFLVVRVNFDCFQNTFKGQTYRGKLVAVLAPQGRRISPVCNVIRIRNSIICETVEIKVDFVEALLHAIYEGRKFAEAIFVVLAAIDTRKRNNSIIENPANMGWLCRRRTRQNLANQIRSEWRDFSYNITLRNWGIRNPRE
jgi:hypothetical protein